MMTDNNNTAEYTAPYHYECPPTTPTSAHHHYSQTPRRQNNSTTTTIQMTTPTNTSSSSKGRKQQQQQHKRDESSSASSSALLWGLPPLPPPSTPRTPAMDNYYAIFGADIEQQQQRQHQQQEEGGMPASARRCCCPGINMVYNFCYWYSTQMDTHPVRTKSMTGGLTSILGDIVAQIIENNTMIRTVDTDGIYWARVLAMFCCGLTFGPMLHYTYELYEYILPIDSCISIDEIIDAKCVGPSACGGVGGTNGISNGNSFEDNSIIQHGKNGGEGIDATTTPPHAARSNSLHIFNSIEGPVVPPPPSMDNNNDNDNHVPTLPSTAIVDDCSTSIPATAYFCHSTMFHSYYTISHRKYVNAFLHVVIDQGVMQIFYVGLMMLITGVVEGRISTLSGTFKADYVPNVHIVWFAALTVLGPIQMMCFRFLSLKWRALSVSLLDVLEVTIMSCIAHRNVEVPTATAR